LTNLFFSVLLFFLLVVRSVSGAVLVGGAVLIGGAVLVGGDVSVGSAILVGGDDSVGGAVVVVNGDFIFGSNWFGLSWWVVVFLVWVLIFLLVVLVDALRGGLLCFWHGSLSLGVGFLVESSSLVKN